MSATQEAYQETLDLRVRKEPRFRLALVQEDGEDYGAESVALNHPGAVARFFQDALSDQPQEVMAVLLVDTRNRSLGYAEVFRGTINRAVCEPRQILQYALLRNAAGFILAHNHPSGDPSPSAEDLAFTRRLSEAGELVGVRLVDHVIVGFQGWTSLRQRGAF